MVKYGASCMLHMVAYGRLVG